MTADSPGSGPEVPATCYLASVPAVIRPYAATGTWPARPHRTSGEKDKTFYTQLQVNQLQRCTWLQQLETRRRRTLAHTRCLYKVYTHVPSPTTLLWLMRAGVTVKYEQGMHIQEWYNAAAYDPNILCQGILSFA